MSDRPRAFVELCCGSAAVTLRLLGGRYAVPPISYMGSKRGYAGAILAALGLRSGIGADSVLLCDAGPWAHVWSVLADPARCADVASILRGWADEDPRELWERLREEHRGEWDGWSVTGAAAWLYVTQRTVSQQEGEGGFLPLVTSGGHKVYAIDRPQIARRVESVAAWLTLGAHQDRSGGFSKYKTGGGDDRRPWDIAVTAHRVESVAAWLQVGAWNVKGAIDSVFPDGRPRPSGFDVVKAYGGDAAGYSGQWKAPPRDWVASRCDALPHGPLSIYAGPAEDLHPPGDCEGVYVYIDPPYSGTTGYAAKMPRETVLEVARRWSDAGAVVCVSEAEPLPLDGWHHVEITGARVGQRRTFSKQQAEWLTMNREPVEVPAVQEVLFP